MRNLSTLLFLLACIAPAQRVGIIDFSSPAPQPSLAFLSQTLPAALAEPLASQAGIQVVERSKLNDLAQEKGLQMSGLVDLPDSIRALLPADALVLGQFEGRLDSLSLRLRVVESGTGALKGVFSRSGPLQEILAGMPTLATQIALSLRGDSTGRLTLSSSPSGAKVFLDGRILGRTPLIDQKIPAGRHELSLELEHHTTWNDSLDIEPSAIVSRKVELAVDHDRTGFWFGGGGRMQGVTRDMDDPIGPEFSGCISVVARGRRWGLEGSYSPPVEHAYLVEYDVPWGTRSTERTLELEMMRLMVIGDVVQAGRWSGHLGLGGALINCTTTPYDLDTPRSENKRQLLGASIAGGVRFELARWIEILVEGQGVHSFDDIEVTDVTHRDLFTSYTETRRFPIQLWNAQIAARIRIP